MYVCVCVCACVCMLTWLFNAGCPCISLFLHRFLPGWLAGWLSAFLHGATLFSKTVLSLQVAVYDVYASKQGMKEIRRGRMKEKYA